MDYLTDEALLDQYFAGDVAGFRAFYQRHAGRVLAYARAKGLNGEAAEEVRQEAFLRLHRSIHRYERGRPALPWFFTIVHHCVIDALRQRQSLQHLQRDSLETLPAKSEGMDAAGAERQAGLLALLSAEQRQVVEMRVFQEQSFKEMAQATGKSETALRKIYERARKKLRDLWEGDVS